MKAGRGRAFRGAKCKNSTLGNSLLLRSRKLLPCLSSQAPNGATLMGNIDKTHKTGSRAHPHRTTQDSFRGVIGAISGSWHESSG